MITPSTCLQIGNIAYAVHTLRKSGTLRLTTTHVYTVLYISEASKIRVTRSQCWGFQFIWDPMAWESEASDAVPEVYEAK